MRFIDIVSHLTELEGGVGEGGGEGGMGGMGKGLQHDRESRRLIKKNFSLQP